MNVNELIRILDGLKAEGHGESVVTLDDHDETANAGDMRTANGVKVAVVQMLIDEPEARNGSPAVLIRSIP